VFLGSGGGGVLFLGVFGWWSCGGFGWAVVMAVNGIGFVVAFSACRVGSSVLGPRSSSRTTRWSIQRSTVRKTVSFCFPFFRPRPRPAVLGNQTSALPFLTFTRQPTSITPVFGNRCALDWACQE
jgi:hypothetical protein